MTIQRIQTNKRMSQAVVHGDTIYLAGQVALDRPGASFADQTRNVLDRIDALLKEVGSDKSKLLSATIWLVRHARLRGDERGVGRLAAGGCRPGAGHRRGQAGDATVHRRDRDHRREVAPVKVAVLGAGVIGVATAYELWRDGHEVVVLDRAAGPRQRHLLRQCRHGRPRPRLRLVVAQQALRTLLRALTRDDLALRFRFRADPQFWRWCWRFYRQCTAERAAANTRRKVALCRYSQERLHAVVADTGAAYGGRKGGALYLYRDAAGLAAAAAKAQILRDEGVEVRAVTPDEAAAIDPAYEPVRDRFAGALYAPGDESGDARLFSLAAWPIGWPSAACSSS